jgi:hypothetical protein
MNDVKKPTMAGGKKSILDRLKKDLEKLKEEAENFGVEEAVIALLDAMAAYYDLTGAHNTSIANFNGVCVIRTRQASDHIAASAEFANGRMSVYRGERKPWQVCITFVDADALWAFLISGAADVLDLLLKNSAQIEGNANYFYRFGFLARELVRETGFDRFLPKSA